MEPKTILFILERETKGAVRYQEVDSNGNLKDSDDSGAVINKVYIRKKGLGTTPPRTLKMVISEA